jgi:phage protein D
MTKELSPAYRLTIGSKRIDTTDEPRASTLVALEIRLDLDVAVDGVTLLLGRAGTFKPAQDDKLVVELGYADPGLERVLTGTVAAVEPGLTTIRVLGNGAARPLLSTFVDRTFESKSAGDVVRALAGEARVDVARSEDGVQLPAYVVDGRRPVAHHLRDLAELSGFDVYANDDGKLVFERFGGGRKVHVLEGGKHLLELDGRRRPPTAGAVEAWGVGGGGGRGGEAWAWLTKDFGPSKGTAGSGAPTVLLERAAIRTSTAARAAARAALTEIDRRALRGRLVTLGRPEIRLGDAIHLRETGEDALDARFQVRAVTHRLSKRRGFTTTIEFRSLERPA